LDYEFGPYRLDTTNRLLMDGGVALPLGPRLIDTLLVLVESAGKIVSKDALIERVWPEGYVDESSLQQNIYLLRRTLSGWDPNAIETLRRRGYRFNPSPVAVEDAPQTESSGSQHNLPSPISEFTGRNKELGAVRALLAESRLITILGAGGIGKTRTAIEAVRHIRADYAQGVWYIDLTALQGGVRIASYIANALDIDAHSVDPSSDLITALREREVLLVLDNCEHVISDVAELCRTLLLACAHVVVLATSRESIRISGERVYRLPPMTNPEGMHLFALRAAALGTNFSMGQRNESTVSAIVEHLDGIPMAIELAAARMGMMTPDQLLSELDRRFFLLDSSDRNAHPRHRSLRSLVQWSYDLLNSEERQLFRSLGVFPRDFDVKAAAAILDIDVTSALRSLEALVNKSLIQPIMDEGQTLPQFRMLETLRLYAQELLSSDDARSTIRQRYSNLRERGEAEGFESHKSVKKPPVREFIGRERELREAGTLLGSERLVTICGVEGIGKTSLARELIRTLSDGERARLIELDQLEETSPLAVTVAKAFGDDEAYRSKGGLLVLDNCDQRIAEVAALVTTLLESKPRLRILCTNREPLGVPLERPYVLRAMQEDDAIELFTQLAPSRSASAAVALLVERLDRVPLAIELAAAQTQTISPAEILANLDRRAEYSKPESDSRQQTVKATIDWSYQLLSPLEREVFRAISVFPADFGLEAAAAVGNVARESVEEALQGLVVASLLIANEKYSETRYVMLESIKEFGLDTLEREGEFERVVDRYAHFFAAYVADVHERHRAVPTDEWVELYERELENIRGAYNISIQRDPHTAFTIALKTAWFFYKSGHPVEGRERLQAALRSVAPSLAIEVHATALRELSILAVGGAEYARSVDFAREALEKIRRSGSDESTLAPYLVTLGNALFETQDYASSERAYREGVEIARRTSNLVSLTVGAFNLGLLLGQCYGRFDEARELLEVAREGSGNDFYRIGVLERGLARLAFLDGRSKEAVNHIRDAYAQFARLKNVELCCDARSYEMSCLVADDRAKEARQVFLSIRDDVLRDPHPETVGLLLDGLSRLAFSEGAYAEAATCFAAADSHRRARGLTLFPLAARLQAQFLEELRAVTNTSVGPISHGPHHDALEVIRTFQ
jgi:predicted ATPase/DNA-binding winged helix-turn-helix (wHTH) protein